MKSMWLFLIAVILIAAILVMYIRLSGEVPDSRVVNQGRSPEDVAGSSHTGTRDATNRVSPTISSNIRPETGDVVQLQELTRLEGLRVQEKWIGEMPTNSLMAFERLFEAKEELRLAKLNMKLQTIEDWISVYGGEVLEPPLFIDIEQNDPYKFDTPENALASYWRAHYRKDVDALFSMCDVYAQEMLRRLGLEPGKGIKYELFDGATKMNVLMRGRLSLDDHDYTLLYVRRLSSLGTNGFMSLQSTILKKDEDRFVVTELPRLSKFASISRVAQINVYPYGPYQVLLPKLKESRLPPCFYTVE